MLFLKYSARFFLSLVYICIAIGDPVQEGKVGIPSPHFCICLKPGIGFPIPCHVFLDCVFGNSKFVVPSTLTIHLGFTSVNSQCLGDNKLAIPSYPVNKYILYFYLLPGDFRVNIICLPITRRLQSKYLIFTLKSPGDRQTYNSYSKVAW
jgi:hypothetical protein